MPRFTLLALVLTGCFPGMIGGGGGGSTTPAEGRPAKVQPLEPATLEEHVAQLKKDSTHVYKIDRSLAAADDLYITLKDSGNKRVSPIHQQIGGASGGYMGVAYGGLVDDKLCFVSYENVGKTGERKARYRIREAHEESPAFVYAVDDLSALKGAAWPPPKHASKVEPPEVISNELDHEDDRALIIQMCAAKPENLATARYLILIQHTKLGEQFLAVPTDTTSRFAANNFFVWKLEGTATASKPDARTDGPAGMSLVKSTVKHGEPVKMKFSPALQAKPGEKYWITIVEAAAGDTAYTSYKYLVDESSIELAAPATAGDYEVRLHGNYPTKTYNLIGRAKLTVK